MNELTAQQITNILASRKPKARKVSLKCKTHFKVGIVSDTHLCSTYEALGELKATYNLFKQEGVEIVLHAGDLIDGDHVYKGQENEVHIIGADKQVAYFCENYPKIDGIKTYFITGNHCLDYWKRSGVDIGNKIIAFRNDFRYLGQYRGRVDIQGVKFDLVHGESGGAYAISYKSQKYAEQIASGQKPDVLIFGHWHQSVYFFYRNMHVINAGCFQRQTSYLLRKGLNPSVGGWILDVYFDGHDIKKITPTFINLF